MNGILKKLMLAMLLILVATPVFAATVTTISKIATTPTDTSIWVSAAYTGDDTTPNNTLTIIYKPSTVTLWSSGTTTNLPHAASPYKYKITGLTNGNAYDVRVLFNDSDGVVSTATGTNPLDFMRVIPSTMMHNSENATTGTRKWDAQGGWGIPGGKYGQFECGTCHQPRAANIKSIKKNIATPDGSNWGSVSQPSVTVTFRSLTTPDGFGDDSTNHTTSQKICEVCHSQTDYHRYNASVGQVNNTHNNNTNCTSSCHKHDVGFKGSGNDCASCHLVATPSQYWSVNLTNPGTPGNAPGAHAKHYGTDVWPAGASYDDSNQTVAGSYYRFNCGKCHEASGNMQNAPDPNITLASTALPPSNGGTYASNVCSNVYCHGSTMSGGTKVNLAWSTTLACGGCHGNTAATYTAPGAHRRHAATVYGASQGMNLPCTDCHGANQGNTGHVDGSVSWSLNTTKNQFGAGAVYNAQQAGSTGAIAPSAAYSQCNNVYCHSSVQNNTGTALGTAVPVAWGTTPVACDSCHGQAAKGTGQPVTGSHWRHASTLSYSCDVCHLNYGDEHPQHANYLIDSGISSTYNGVAAATYSQSTHTPGVGGYGNCSSVYCHGSYVGSGGTNTAPTWGGTAACGTCHLASSATPATTPATGSHQRHAGAWTTAMQLACTKCHGPSNGTGATGHMDLHVDWRFDTSDGRVGAAAKYNGSSIGSTGAKAGSTTFGSCSSIYCHSTVQSDGGSTTGVTYASPVWGSSGAAQCGSCHGAGDPTGRPNTGKHQKHVTTLGYLCSTCHFGAGDETIYHARGTINLSINTILYGPSQYSQGNQGPGTGYGNCRNVYCHGGYTGSGGISTVAWTTVGAPGVACGTCHLAGSATPATTPTTGSHPKHAGNWTTAVNMACKTCHGPGNGIGTIGHMDLNVQWNFDTSDTRISWFTVGRYNGSTMGSTGGKAATTPYRACTNLYCHSNVQANGGNAGPTVYATPTWGSTGSAQCGSCHAMPNTTGGHTRHQAVYGTTAGACSICHFGSGDETPYHARGTINLRIGTTYWANLTTATYSQGDHKGAGGAYGNCSNTTCHGGPSKIWSTVTTNHQCTKCHGNDWTTTGWTTANLYKAAPGADQAGHDNWNSTGTYVGRVSSNPVVGAHDAHLRALSTISRPVECNQCHVVPGGVTSVGHNNTGRRAEITWGTWANWQTTVPAANWSSNALTQCSNIYCHGGKMKSGDNSGFNRAPSWTSGNYLGTIVWQAITTQGGCGMCHGAPPTGGTQATTHNSQAFPASCTTCHPHVAANGSFTTVAFHIDGIVQAAGGDCLGCHGGAPKTKSIGSASGATIRQIVGTGGDFNMLTSMTGANGTRHLFGANTIIKWDCTVCHLEGWYSTAGMNSAYHNDSQGLVDLRNVDLSNDTGWAVDNKKWTSSTAVPNLGWRTNSYANLDNFCVSCHDANGALAAYVNSTNSGLGGGTSRALTPFNTSDTRGGKIVASTEHPSAQRDRVIDIKSAFNPGTNGPGANYNGNPSQHAVLGQRYSTINANWGTTGGGAWTTNIMLRKMNTMMHAVKETAVLSCADCHILDAGRGAHGGVNQYHLWFTNGKENCWRCHNNGVYNATARAGVSRTNHSGLDTGRTFAGSTVYGIVANDCLLCHANWVGNTGNTITTVSRQQAYGGIHGNTWGSGGIWGTTTAWYTTPGGRKTAYRFVPGTWMKPSPTTDAGWNATGTGNCYFQTDTEGFTNCSSHDNGNVTGTPTYNYGRPTRY